MMKNIASDLLKTNTWLSLDREANFSEKEIIINHSVCLRKQNFRGTYFWATSHKAISF